MSILRFAHRNDPWRWKRCQMSSIISRLDKTAVFILFSWVLKHWFLSADCLNPPEFIRLVSLPAAFPVDHTHVSHFIFPNGTFLIVTLDMNTPVCSIRHPVHSLFSLIIPTEMPRFFYQYFVHFLVFQNICESLLTIHQMCQYGWKSRAMQPTVGEL